MSQHKCTYILWLMPFLLVSVQLSWLPPYSSHFSPPCYRFSFEIVEFVDGKNDFPTLKHILSATNHPRCCCLMPENISFHINMNRKIVGYGVKRVSPFFVDNDNKKEKNRGTVKMYSFSLSHIIEGYFSHVCTQKKGTRKNFMNFFTLARLYIHMRHMNSTKH